MGINASVIIFIIISKNELFFDYKDNLKFFTKSNSFDFALDIFVDEVDLDVN